LKHEEDLSIDWIESNATKSNEKVVIITTGEHGVEGYVGSAMMQLFVEKYLPFLDPHNTGIFLVHAINPWGMKHHRRGNKDNIDLNRTFLWKTKHDQGFNMEYDVISKFLNPQGTLGNLFIADIRYLIGLIQHIAIMGMNNFRLAFLLGQYRNSKGLYFGGNSRPEETQLLVNLYKQIFDTYEQILHMDMHTGYGPRYQMSLVNSSLDNGSSEYFSKRFNYPLVVAATANEFYAIHGDMIDYLYSLRDDQYPGTHLYATSFEFGTLGDTLYGLLNSPRVMVHENRAYWNGTKNHRIDVKAKYGFEELFNPGAKKWRKKAVKDANQAIKGILNAEGYI